jgi:hypothetical protein
MKYEIFEKIWKSHAGGDDKQRIQFASPYVLQRWIKLPVFAIVAYSDVVDVHARGYNIIMM